MPETSTEPQGRTRITVTITDTMSFWNNQVETYVFYRELAKTHEQTYDVPSSWIADGKLTDVGVDNVLRHRYGATWNQGNGDGSRYQVLEVVSAIATEVTATPIRID